MIIIVNAMKCYSKKEFLHEQKVTKKFSNNRIELI